MSSQCCVERDSGFNNRISFDIYRQTEYGTNQNNLKSCRPELLEARSKMTSLMLI